MVTIKVESKDEMQFLQTAFEHAWKIKKCDANDIFNVAMKINALSLENQTLELTEEQTETFRTVMQLYNDVIADDVEWSYDYIKQLPDNVKDAPRFYAMLKDFYLDKHAKEAETLFKYWITQDWGYFNSVLIDLLDDTKDIGWLQAMHWCRSNNPSNTETDDEIAYYKKEYCQ